MKSKKKQTENVHRSDSNILCLTKERLNADGANKMVGL